MSKRMTSISAVLFLAGQLISPALAIDNSKMLDLEVGDRRLTGRVLHADDQFCWFLGRDGHLQQLSISSVTRYSELADRFKSLTPAEFKTQLHAEFGKNVDIRITNHYVVVANSGMSEKYAEIMERIYREFLRSFRARGFRVIEPEFPLVAIVFPDEALFKAYCERQKARVQPGMVGFYLPSTNRIALYERPNQVQVDQTVIHEAIHQVAFNTGIHSRIAKHPHWVVEGLATVFEAEGIRTREGTSTPAERVNRERFLWFQDYAKSRRPGKDLERFLSDDDSFERSALDAYSEAWALSFFLIETRPTNYARYLKRLVDRDPSDEYSAEQRRQDFSELFGTEIGSLESTYLKFMKRLADR